MRKLSLLLVLLPVVCFAQDRPNILIVLTDDQGYGELSCHGNPVLKTPNLDAFHGQAARFTEFHVSPTCAPTRTSIQTGRQEFYSGVTHTIHERERMSLKRITLAQTLKNAGYATAIFGKWHLGDQDPYQPEKRGFDEVFIHGAGGIGQTYAGSCGDAPDNKYFDPAIKHNGKFVKTSGYCTDVFFNQATAWLDGQRKKDAPFFAMITTNAPHGPYICPPAWSKPYKDAGLKENEANYYGMIANIDNNFGKLMAKLKEWDIEKKTLVIFMTDNGHSVGSLYNAGMRAAKGSPYRGGTRVPSLWRLPGLTKAGTDIGRLTGAIDLYPTLCELAWTKVPDGVTVDGRSLVPLLKDSQAPWADRFLFVHVGRWAKGKAADSKYAHCAVMNQRYRLVNNKELYDIEKDPGEKENVIAQHPEEAEKLRAAYDKWWSEVLPCMENEDAPVPAVNPFKEQYWKQFGGGPK